MTHTEDDTFRHLTRPPIQEMIKILSDHVIHAAIRNHQFSPEELEQHLIANSWTVEEYIKATLFWTRNKRIEPKV